MAIDSLQFTPSHVDGLANVLSVRVFAERIELATESGVVVHCYGDIARWPTPVWFWRLVRRLRLMRPSLAVADRWFQTTGGYFDF